MPRCILVVNFFFFVIHVCLQGAEDSQRSLWQPAGQHLQESTPAESWPVRHQLCHLSEQPSQPAAQLRHLSQRPRLPHTDIELLNDRVPVGNSDGQWSVEQHVVLSAEGLRQRARAEHRSRFGCAIGFQAALRNFREAGRLGRVPVDIRDDFLRQ